MQNVDDRQVVALADFKVHLVVRRCDFQNAGAEFRIDRFVRDDWKFFARERTPDVFADKIDISSVARMNGDCRIGHDCLRSRRRNFKKAPRLFDDLVADKI